MLKRFVFEIEDRPRQRWRERFAQGREEAERWYFGQGRARPAIASECRRALGQHMPELVPLYDEACRQVGDDALAHCVISQYRPPPAAGGCSQLIWLGDGGPALIRNYDFPIDVVSDRFELTAWFDAKVIAKAQRPWGGCLDGMNEYGLVASTTLGGNAALGEGFAIILMLRYVLETCRQVDQAVAALSVIPIAQSQNVTLLDRSGDYATLFLGPDRKPECSQLRVCTNHQTLTEPPASAAVVRSVERQEVLLAALADPSATLVKLINRFFEPPIYSKRAQSPTVYTAVYRPTEGRVDYLWPGMCRSQGFGKFTCGEYTHDYGQLFEDA